jgi:hypothetical protein
VRLADDFERWLSLLADDQPWLSDSENLENRAAFHGVSMAIHAVLRDCQEAALTGGLKRWAADLILDWHNTRAKVITLNYDTLVELAFHQVAPPSSRPGAPYWWRDLLPLPFPIAATRVGATYLNDYSGEPETFQLLKLHGSLNWYYGGPLAGAGDIVYDTGVWRRWDGLPMITEGQPDETARIEALCAKAVLDKLPLLIPPTATKGPYYAAPSVGLLWRLAREALKNADELVIMGYSAPITDLVMGALLRTEFGGSTVVPVTRDPRVVDRLHVIFQGRPTVTIRADYAGIYDPISRFVRRECPPPAP